MSRALTGDAALWDEVWAEYDARHPRLPPKPATPPLPAREQHPARAPRAPRRWRWRLLVTGLAAALLAYAASPLAAAVQIAAAVQRADGAAMVPQVDWERLRPAIEARLEAMAAQRLDGPAPAFVRQMQAELAAQLASPQGLGALVGGAGARGEAPAREWLQAAQPLDGGRWSVTLARPEAPTRATTLTLELQDPLRLRWQVVEVSW